MAGFRCSRRSNGRTRCHFAREALVRLPLISLLVSLGSAGESLPGEGPREGSIHTATNSLWNDDYGYTIRVRSGKDVEEGAESCSVYGRWTRIGFAMLMFATSVMPTVVVISASASGPDGFGGFTFNIFGRMKLLQQMGEIKIPFDWRGGVNTFTDDDGKWAAAFQQGLPAEDAYKIIYSTTWFQAYKAGLLVAIAHLLVEGYIVKAVTIKGGLITCAEQAAMTTIIIPEIRSRFMEMFMGNGSPSAIFADNLQFLHFDSYAEFEDQVITKAGKEKLNRRMSIDDKIAALQISSSQPLAASSSAA